MATGFHGFHVIIGTLFLLISLYRLILDHFSTDHHFGFEAAAWYWHFVDVVWLFLVICIYLWGNMLVDGISWIFFKDSYDILSVSQESYGISAIYSKWVSSNYGLDNAWLEVWWKN